MKALEMLKDARNVYVDCNRPGDIQKVDEAIAELEELQQPKSCDGCKHYKFTYNSNDGAVRQLMTICSDCFRRLNRDRYEPEEQ